jgi:signal transduction histidine kinase
MPSQRRWRERLLGSLQGQLQLATYLVVFAGFTGASTAGLWVGQRNLIHNETQTLRGSARSIQASLRANQSAKARADAADELEQLQLELLVHSNHRTRLWIEQPDGRLIVPARNHLRISDMALDAAMQSNPGRVVGRQEQISLGDTRYLSELVEQLPGGGRLWILHEVGANQQALGNYLQLMILTWGSCLAITLLAVSWLVRRIVKPLEQLNATTSQVTADTLTTARLQLTKGPIEVVQLGQTYNELLERLALSWSQQRQFVSAVSHELRTPLTIVQGYIHRTIKRGDNLSSDQVHGLQTAKDESIRMQRLMDELLDLSRGDSGQLAIACEPVRLADQLEQVADMACHTLQRPLQLELPDDPQQRDAIAQADPARLRQVLLDLIENADKYSPEGRPILLKLQHDGNNAAIEVIDQGIGIPDDELEAVFERFQRGSNAPVKTGSGLGLSLVKLLVVGMGGSIEVRSRLNEGSCFTVHLSP